MELLISLIALGFLFSIYTTLRKIQRCLEVMEMLGGELTETEERREVKQWNYL